MEGIFGEIEKKKSKKWGKIEKIERKNRREWGEFGEIFGSFRGIFERFLEDWNRKREKTKKKSHKSYYYL